jgi:hypothetical protein
MTARNQIYESTPSADGQALPASPFVVHCKRAKYDVYIGRPSKWGNPFEIGKDGDRKTVIRKYHEWIVTQPHLMAALPELCGKVLGCWCAPKACHGDVLVSLANSQISGGDGPFTPCQECKKNPKPCQSNT